MQRGMAECIRAGVGCLYGSLGPEPWSVRAALLQGKQLAAPFSAYDVFLYLEPNFLPDFPSFCACKGQRKEVPSGGPDEEDEEESFLKFFARCESTEPDARRNRVCFPFLQKHHKVAGRYSPRL